jgi:DNA (cytosine-5)-methyltransferase 1
MIINKNKLQLKNLNFIDLFCGIGGFRLALNSFGAKCLFSSDFDKECQKIYELNFKEKPYGDITKININEIPSHDLLSAGFPCQPFSISGKQGGFDDTRGTLFFDVARIIKKKKPKIIFLENVANFASHDNGKTLSTVRKVLIDLKYNFFYKILNSSDFGVPQSRKRTYMIVIKKSYNDNEFIFPKPINKDTRLLDFLEKKIDPKSIVFKNKKAVLKKNITENANLFNLLSNKPIRIGTVNKGGQGDRIYDPLGHAITLSAHGGGTGSKTGLYLINNKIRKLLPRECANISGFPNNFKLSDNPNVSYKQFGNTVVVNVIQHIVNELIDQKFI